MTLVGVSIRNMAHNRFRLILTILAIGVSMFAFLLIQTVLAAWKSSEDRAVRYRVVGYNVITGNLPVSYMSQIRSNPHVKAATYAVYFDGVDPSHSSTFFGSAAVDGPTYLDVFPDIAIRPEEKKAWLEDRRGALIGDSLAQSMGWKVGDRVTLESSIYPNVKSEPWTFTVRAIYTTGSKSLPRKYFVFHFDYLNEGIFERERNTFRWYTALVDDASNSPGVVASIDQYFDDKEFQTQSMDEETFRTSIFAGAATVQTALQIVSFMLLGLTMLILGNTISMGVYERTTQYGTLRALGFRPRHVAGFIMTEAALIGLLGGLLGCAAAIAVVRGVLKKVVENELPNFFPDFHLPVSIALLALGLAVALGVLAAALPAIRVARLSVVDALRRVA